MMEIKHYESTHHITLHVIVEIINIYAPRYFSFCVCVLTLYKNKISLKFTACALLKNWNKVRSLKTRLIGWDIQIYHNT